VLLALSTSVLYYWNIAAYLMLLPAIGLLLNWRKLFWAHVIYGIFAATLVFVNYAVLPLSVLVGKPDWESSVVYGWADVGAHVAALQAAEPADFLAGTRYTLAAQLAFALHDPEVTALANRRDQFDFWFDSGAHKGQNALVLADEKYTIDEAQPLFAACAEVDRIPVTRFGHLIQTFIIYRCTGLKGIDLPA
jgi:hypothetical protein